MIRTIAGGIATAIILSACSVGLPDNIDEYMRGNGAISPNATDAGPQPLSACEPKLESNTTVNNVWHPPGALHRDACSPQQADQLVQCVYNDPFHMTKPCQDFLAAPVNQACVSCGQTSSTDAVWGPLVSGVVDSPGTPYENVDGCVAAASGDTSVNGCGPKFLAKWSCESIVCERCLPSTRTSCAERADQTLCAAFAGPARCADPFIEQCLPSNSPGPMDLGRSLVKLFCQR